MAILGTFATNIWLFTHPAGLLGTLVEPAAGLRPGVESTVFAILFTLSNGKFLALLMMMFGIGVTLQHAAWVRRHPDGERGQWLRRYTPRAFVLLIDGFVNFVLVAEFDVLMGYAFTGFVAAAIIAGSPRSRSVWTWISASAHTLVILGISTLALAAGTALGPPESWSLWNGINPYRDGSFLDLALFRLDNLIVFRIEPVLIFALGIALFLIGARLYEGGLFTDRGARLRRICMALGVAALPVDLALGVAGEPALMLVQRYLTAPFVALGLIAVIAHCCLPGRPGSQGSRLSRSGTAAREPRSRLIRPMSARISAQIEGIGRMALSCYVGQNLVAGALFLGWGLDLTGRFPDQRLLLSVGGFVAVLAVVSLFSTAWQRWVPGPASRGPLEWLTHRAVDVSRR